MYLLNEKLRNFFTTLMIINILCFVVSFFYMSKGLVHSATYFNFLLIYLLSFYMVFFVYVVYPLVRIIFKKYGSFIQKVLVILILIFSVLVFLFPLSRFTVVYMLYLAIFLNFSSDIENGGDEHYIVSFPIKKDNYNLSFSRILNSSSFNILMSVVLLTVIVVESFYYFDPYVILASIFSIVLVISSIFYGKAIN